MSDYSYTIHSRILWRTDISTPWENFFYPSTAKHIKKSIAKFSEIFQFENELVTPELFEKKFFPLYKRQIAERPNYILDSSKKHDDILNRIDSGISYFLLGFHRNNKDEFVGGILYCIEEDIPRFSLRVFDREINRQYKFETTIDYWAESILVEMLQKKGFSTLRHGVDHYPNINRLGLPLFKLKIGAKPTASPAHHKIITNKSTEFKTHTPVIFFDSPDNNNYFQRAIIIQKNGEADNEITKELKTILKWARIEIIEEKI